MTVVVDDAQLSRLAVQPAEDAAPALNRPAAFRPVVLLCCVVPPLWFAAWSVLDNETAAWALRALAVRHAQRLEEWFEPGVQWKECELQSAPPLASWLTAALMPLFPDGTAGAAVAVSALSLIATSAMIWLWTREAIGERAALLVILLFAAHPQVATLAASGEPIALTIFLLVTSGWGFWGHLEQNVGAVSFRLLVSGVALGLGLLAGGWMALAFFAVVMLISLGSRTGMDPLNQRVGEKTAVRGVLLMGVTAAAIALWWPIMMAQSHGAAFWQEWIGIAIPSSPDRAELDLLSTTPWSVAPGILLGWWCLGCFYAIRSFVSGSTIRDQRWHWWLLTWSLVGISGRLVWGNFGGTVTTLRAWDAFLNLPALIIAAQGLDRAVRRETSHFGLAIAIAITSGGIFWEQTHHLGAAVLIGLSTLGILLLSAPLTIGLRRPRSSWSEKEIRAWVLFATIATIIGHAASTIVPITRQRFDHLQWEAVRRQLATQQDVQQTSIVTNDQRELTPWIYLLRSLWPTARFSVANGWDAQINATLQNEAKAPRSRIVVLDWSRTGLRVRSDVGTVWQVDSIVEPRAYRHRRLAAYLIHPAGSPRPNPSSPLVAAP